MARVQPESDNSEDLFVLATDPEAWLLIEERPKGTTSAWHYAFARMNSQALIARHHDRDVWEVPWEPQYRDPSKPYFVRAATAPVPEP
jgi:hypothetical protein